MRIPNFFSLSIPSGQRSADITCGGTEYHGFCCANGTNNCWCWNDGCVITAYYKANECDCTEGGTWCECNRDSIVVAGLGLALKGRSR